MGLLVGSDSRRAGSVRSWGEEGKGSSVLPCVLPPPQSSHTVELDEEAAFGFFGKCGLLGCL